MLSHATVTLNEGRGHSNWFPTKWFGGVHHHTNFGIPRLHMSE